MRFSRAKKWNYWHQFICFALINIHAIYFLSPGNYVLGRIPHPRWKCTYWYQLPWIIVHCNNIFKTKQRKLTFDSSIIYAHPGTLGNVSSAERVLLPNFNLYSMYMYNMAVVKILLLVGNIAGFVWKKNDPPHSTPHNIVPYEVLLWHVVLVRFCENQQDMVRLGMIH